MNKLTNSQLKALKILSKVESISARGFADEMWGGTETNMFTSTKNTGHGPLS